MKTKTTMMTISVLLGLCVTSAVAKAESTVTEPKTVILASSGTEGSVSPYVSLGGRIMADASDDNSAQFPTTGPISGGSETTSPEAGRRGLVIAL